MPTSNLKLCSGCTLYCTATVKVDVWQSAAKISCYRRGVIRYNPDTRVIAQSAAGGEREPYTKNPTRVVVIRSLPVKTQSSDSEAIPASRTRPRADASSLIHFRLLLTLYFCRLLFKTDKTILSQLFLFTALLLLQLCISIKSGSRSAVCHFRTEMS